MTGAELDAEYHNWQEHAVDAGWSHGELCESWNAGATGGNCQRPIGHDGDHAAVLGMDPDINDWVRWDAANVAR